MKATISLFLILLFAGHILTAQIPVLRTNSKTLDVYDKTWSLGNWSLAPEYNPDVYSLKVEGDKQKVIFRSDIDSLVFWVEPDKTYDFLVLYQDKDSCWTQINTIPTFKFNADYISKHKDTFSFVVPEVQELVHIIMAISPEGILDSNQVNHFGNYYKEVMDYFEPYSNEPIVKKMDTLLKSDLYTQLKMDANAFYFSGDEIKNDSVYNVLSWNGINYIAPYINQIQDFAKKSNFRNFYNSHQPYYNKLIKEMEKQSPIGKQWRWLENQFYNKYDNYIITFSPLTYGSHSTNRFVQDNFKQTMMFVCGPRDEGTENEKEALMTRVVFTEIDHNYVNPVSEKYIDLLVSSVSPLDSFASQMALQSYGHGFPVFNEYMTWAVYTAYAYDMYDSVTFNFAINKMENLMKRRGFTRFNKFNQYFLDLYKNKTDDQKLEDLYPLAIQWFQDERDSF